MVSFLAKINLLRVISAVKTLSKLERSRLRLYELILFSVQRKSNSILEYQASLLPITKSTQV